MYYCLFYPCLAHDNVFISIFSNIPWLIYHTESGTWLELTWLELNWLNLASALNPLQEGVLENIKAKLLHYPFFRDLTIRCTWADNWRKVRLKPTFKKKSLNGWFLLALNWESFKTSLKTISLILVQLQLKKNSVPRSLRVYFEYKTYWVFNFIRVPLAYHFPQYHWVPRVM